MRENQPTVAAVHKVRSSVDYVPSATSQSIPRLSSVWSASRWRYTPSSGILSLHPPATPLDIASVSVYPGSMRVLLSGFWFLVVRSLPGQRRAFPLLCRASSAVTPTPNQALQRIRLRVTAPASTTAFPPTTQVPRRSGVPLSLWSLAVARAS